MLRFNTIFWSFGSGLLFWGHPLDNVSTLCLKTPPYILNNSVKNEPILTICGKQNPDEISRKKIINWPTSPE